MSTTPQPETDTPARPQFTIETGRYYADGSIDWLTPEVIAVANCPADRTPRVQTMNLERYQSPRYGIYAAGNGIFTAYPIKPGTYPMDIHLEFVQKDPETPSTTQRFATVVVDLVVTGAALGTEFDREVLHHLHPDIPALDSRVTAAQTAADAAGSAAAAAQRRGDAASADAHGNKEENDRQGQAIGQLTTRVTTAEGKILAIEESIANSRD